jgi:hypothetical protein
MVYVALLRWWLNQRRVGEGWSSRCACIARWWYKYALVEFSCSTGGKVSFVRDLIGFVGFAVSKCVQHLACTLTDRSQLACSSLHHIVQHKAQILELGVLESIPLVN